MGESPSYEGAVTAMRRPIAAAGTGHSGRLRDLVRQATLAASSHNTQPWKFTLAERRITIRPDFTRRTPIVDPDDHHLFVSLGCATENLVHAALASGLHADVRIHDDSIDVAFDGTTSVRSPLFDAIPVRQCSRSIYDGRPLAATELRTVEAIAHGDGVHAVVLTAPPQIETVLDYVTRGNTAQIGDRAFVEELKTWIRFSESEAVRTGDGLFSRTTGNPAVPRWLGTRLLGTLLTPKSENDKCAKQLRSSAGVIVFVSDMNDRQHWIEVGRCYERVALHATTLGICTAFLNQPVEIARLNRSWPERGQSTRARENGMLLAARAFAVWLLLITAEVVHGIVRTLVLTPVVGDFRARQLGVFTGSLLIVLITALTIRWIRASRPRTLLMIGSAWVVLTVTFEISLGRMMSYSWERLGSDYNMLEGGLLPIGFVIMATSPLIAARLRGMWNYG